MMSFLFLFLIGWRWFCWCWWFGGYCCCWFCFCCCFCSCCCCFCSCYCIVFGRGFLPLQITFFFVGMVHRLQIWLAWWSCQDCCCRFGGLLSAGSCKMGYLLAGPTEVPPTLNDHHHILIVVGNDMRNGLIYYVVTVSCPSCQSCWQNFFHATISAE